MGSDKLDYVHAPPGRKEDRATDLVDRTQQGRHWKGGARVLGSGSVLCESTDVRKVRGRKVSKEAATTIPGQSDEGPALNGFCKTS